MNKPMNPKIKARWIRALLSGKYKQGKLHLRQIGKKDDKFCCLGVLCEIAVKDGIIPKPTELFESDDFFNYGAERTSSYLPVKVQEWAGIDTAVGAFDGVFSLVDLNDSGKRFKTIAKVISEKF